MDLSGFEIEIETTYGEPELVLYHQPSGCTFWLNLYTVGSGLDDIMQAAQAHLEEAHSPVS